MISRYLTKQFYINLLTIITIFTIDRISKVYVIYLDKFNQGYELFSSNLYLDVFEIILVFPIGPFFSRNEILVEKLP